MDKRLRLGFIGTGTITQAIIHGFMHSSLAKDPQSYQIIVSNRNAKIAKALKTAYPNIFIAKDNQDVVDQSEKVFICIASQIAQEVLESLKFSGEHEIISLVAMAKKEEIENWTKNKAKVYRAVPLPFIENRKGMTPFYPKNAFLENFFDALGGGIALEREEEFSLFLLAGSMMGVYYRFMRGCSDFFCENGLEKAQIEVYLATMFGNLADVMRDRKHLDLLELEQEYSTKGGTNAALSECFEKNGGIKALENSALAVFDIIKRIK